MSRLLTWMLQTPCNCNSKDSQRVVLRFAAAALANRMKSFSSASGASFSVDRARLGSSPEEASAQPVMPGQHATAIAVASRRKAEFRSLQ